MTIKSISEDLVGRIKIIDKNINILTVIYYLFGFIGLVLNLVITSLTSNNINSLLFQMSVIVSIISTSLNFFKIETKIQKMVYDRIQYNNLLNDIKCYSIENKDENYQLNSHLDGHFEKETIEKLKIIENDDVQLCF